VMKGESCTERLLQVFHRLLRHFGPRHWWPAETPFEVVVGAILTQSVAWRNVEVAIVNLKRLGLLDPRRILSCPQDVLEEAVRPTRYYRQKAVRLRDFCRVLCQEFEGKLDAMFSLEVDVLRKKLLAIKGIGPETADSIILYAADKPVFVVDAYTKRIFNRLGFFDDSLKYHEIQEFFALHLPQDVYLFNEYHALIDALGQNICFASSPECSGCPVQDMCRFAGGVALPQCSSPGESLN